jgi:hypothetical protein
VATGTWAIDAKLPGLEASVGTAAQPGPNSAIVVAMLGAVLAAGAGAPAPLPDVSSLLQAASEMVNRAAAAIAVNLAVRMAEVPLEFSGR